MSALTFATPTTAAAQWSWLVEASVGRHRKSTSDFCEIIEIYFPTLPKVDLHARDVIPRPGWDVWGLEEPTSARDPHAVDHRRVGLMKHGPCSRYLGHGGAVGQ